ncbi:MAG: HAMP domain-containing histidine kinase [Planctomycetes bacterium]|nr:HAMP domain-containing histidine kinase [Planctomycetota bacterium]
MALSRRITLVFVLLAAPILGLLVINARSQSERARASFRDDVLIPTSGVTAGMVREAVDRVLQNIVTATARPGPIVAIEIGELTLWDSPDLRALLDKAVLMHVTAADVALYNPRPSLIFEEEGPGGMSRGALRSLARKIDEGTRVEFDELGRPLVRGRFRGPGLDEWGYLFRLRKQEPSDYDPAGPIRVTLWIVVFGMLVLLGLLLAIVKKTMLEPLADIEVAALRMSAGDYGARLAHDPRTDELGSVSRAMNAAMVELQLFQGRMEGLVGEATERFKKAERHLVVAQRLAAMGHLAAGIAHEINNPLGGVMNALQSLSRPDLPPERRTKYLHVAEDGLGRIRDIVGRVLATTPRHARVGPVLVADLFQQATGLIQHRFRRENIQLAQEAEDGLVVLGDRRELGQVVLNLLINACDALEENGGGRVCLRSRGTLDRVEIEVEDDGHGIADDVKDHIFDLFFTTKPGQKGTGLGLGIVHNIVTGHGGTISVSSEPGRGTTFLVSLPRGGEDEGVAQS